MNEDRVLIWNVPEPESHTATLEQNIFLPPLDFFLSISRAISLRDGGFAASSLSSNCGRGRIPSNSEEHVDTTAGQTNVRPSILA